MTKQSQTEVEPCYCAEGALLGVKCRHKGRIPENLTTLIRTCVDWPSPSLCVGKPSLPCLLHLSLSEQPTSSSWQQRLGQRAQQKRCNPEKMHRMRLTSEFCAAAREDCTMLTFPSPSPRQICLDKQGITFFTSLTRTDSNAALALLGLYASYGYPSFPRPIPFLIVAPERQQKLSMICREEEGSSETLLCLPPAVDRDRLHLDDYVRQPDCRYPSSASTGLQKPPKYLDDVCGGVYIGGIGQPYSSCSCKSR